MAIILCLLIFLTNSWCFDMCATCFASETPTYFARVLQDDVKLYKSPIDAEDFTNVMFVLPKTYFVQLLDNAGNDFFKAKYKNFYGYVKKDKVMPVVGTPQTPYLDDINFRVFAELSRDMRTSPTTKPNVSNQVVYVPNLSRNLTFFGQIVGDSLIEGRTNVWFYCKYSADKDYYGYVYSDFCDELPTTLPINSEEISYTTAPDFNASQPEKTSIPLENKATGIVIAILSVPACLVVYLILRSSKFISTKQCKQKEITNY